MAPPTRTYNSKKFNGTMTTTDRITLALVVTETGSVKLPVQYWSLDLCSLLQQSFSISARKQVSKFSEALVMVQRIVPVLIHQKLFDKTGIMTQFLVDESCFLAMVGSLVYLIICTRSDIAYVAQRMSYFFYVNR